MKHKKHLYKLKTSVIASLLFFSCQSPVENQKYTSDQFHEVGALHNSSLDFVIKDLQLNKTQYLSGRADGKYTLKEFLKANQVASLKFAEQQIPTLTNDQRDFLDKEFGKITKHFDNYLDSDLKKRNRRTDYYEDPAVALNRAIMQELTNYLTPSQIDLVGQIVTGLESAPDLNSASNALNVIESQVYNLPPSDQAIVFEALSIARSSFVYWEANYETWQQVIGDIMYYDSNGDMVIARTAYDRKGIIAGVDVGCGVLMGISCAASGPVGWIFSLKAVGLAAAVGSGIMAVLI